MSIKTKNEIIEELFDRRTLGIKFGLDRILEALEFIGNPQQTYKCIHIAGTNGKGSVCAYIESILRNQGSTTGLFTSPHIINFEERFLINGKPVLYEEWLKVYKSIKDVVNRFSLTFFEISAIIAFVLFKINKVEWAIIETGLGGRLDATNVVIPKVSAITCIGIDHIEYLGNSIFDIAKEKLGIVKNGIPLVLGVQENQAVIPLAKSVCGEKNSPITVVKIEDAKNINLSKFGSNFVVNNTNFSVPLQGIHQVKNALCAIKVVEKVGVYDKEVISTGLKNTNFPGRFQETHVNGKSVIFDVAHNPQAGKSLCQLLKSRYSNENICIIAGVMADKEVYEMMSEYTTCANMVILTRPETSRSADPVELLDKMSIWYKEHSKIILSVKEAVFYALDNFNGLICVTGSFYTVGEAMMALSFDPFKIN